MMLNEQSLRHNEIETPHEILNAKNTTFGTIWCCHISKFVRNAFWNSSLSLHRCFARSSDTRSDNDALLPNQWNSQRILPDIIPRTKRCSIILYCQRIYFIRINDSQKINREATDYQFLIRRVFRIAPMFYIAITASLTNLYIHGAREFPIPVSDLILGILFLHGWSQRAINSVAIGGWSVADEFSFYLIFPIIYRLMDNIKTSLVFYSLALLFFLCWVLRFIIGCMEKSIFSVQMENTFHFYGLLLKYPYSC